MNESLRSQQAMYEGLLKHFGVPPLPKRPEQPAPESTVQPCDVAAANHNETDE